MTDRPFAFALTGTPS